MEIFRPPFVQKAVIVFMMQFVAFGSYNILRLWLPEMLTIADTSTLDPEEGLCSLLFEGNLGRSNLTTESFRNEQIFSKLMLVNTGRLIAQILFLVIVGFIGKKIIQLNCTLGAAVCSILIPYVSADYIVIITSCLLGFLHVYMFTNISIVVKVFPTRMRATTVGAMMMIVRMGTIPLNFLIVNLLYTYCEYFFYVLSSSLLVTAGLTLIVRRKPMEEEVSTPSKENEISTPSKENE